MKRKFLEDLGLDAEVVQKIMDENGKDITSLEAREDDLTEQLNVKETTITEKNNKIAELEKVDVEAIKKEQFELGKAEGSKEIEEFKKKNALNKALKGFKVKDPELIKPKLKLDQIEYEADGDEFKVSKGLEEQVNPLKETYGYVFEDDNPLPSFSGPTPGPQNKISGDPNKMDYNTYKEWRKQNN